MGAQNLHKSRKHLKIRGAKKWYEASSTARTYKC